MLLIMPWPRGQARRCGSASVSSSSSVRVFSGTPSSTYTLIWQREAPQQQLYLQGAVTHVPVSSLAGGCFCSPPSPPS